MFKGIDLSRPWPTTGMTSAKWLSVPVRTVLIRSLILTQKGIYFEPLLEPAVPVGGDGYPHVILWNSIQYLEDGHHRVVRAAIAGLLNIQARVLFVE